MRLRGIAIAAVSSVVASSALTGAAAVAATVDSIRGEVSINRGGGFETLAKPSAAAVGDSLMAAPGGSAEIVYSPECAVKVEPGTVVFVAPEAPCDIGVESALETTGGSLKDEPVVEKPHDVTPYIIGAAVVGGIGACVALCSGDDKPASP